MRLRLSSPVLCGMLAALPAPMMAQHEHHAAPDSSAQMLRTMTVRERHEPISLRSGWTIVNPKAVAALSGSIADILRTIPGVTMDADGNVSMRGNARALVMINGRRTALTGEALAAYLQQMPAQSLERIETTTAPSAKDDANGAAGALNLVFRDADDAEHTTPLRSAYLRFASQQDFAASAAATGHAGRLVHWSAAYSASASRPRTTADITRWTSLQGDEPFSTDEDVRSDASHRLHSVIAGATLTPTPATSLGLRGTYAWMQGTSSTRRYAEYHDASGSSATSTTASVTEHAMPTAELIGTASVERGRLRLASEMRASLVRGEDRGDYDDVDGDFRYLSAVMHSRQREFVMRNDVRARWSGLDLGFGHEWRRRRAIAVHDAVHFSTTETLEFQHLSTVHAGYLSAARTVGVFRGEAGVRVEGERDVRSLDSASVLRTVRVFPSVSGEWLDADRGLRYRLAYGRRVSRPTWEQLNPFSMGDEGFNEILGNPTLNAEYVDQVEGGVERRSERFATVVHLTPFVRWSQHSIRLVASPTSRGVTRTPQNVGRTRIVGADLGLTARPVDRVEVLVGGTIGARATLRMAVDARVTERNSVNLLLAPTRTTLAMKRSMAEERGHVTLQVSNPWRVDRRTLRHPDSLTDEMIRSTRQPALEIVGSFAVGGVARDVR